MRVWPADSDMGRKIFFCPRRCPDRTRSPAFTIEARRLIGELKYRIWRLYLAGAAYYFQSGKLDLYQSLLAKTKAGRSGLPLTRNDWYLR